MLTAQTSYTSMERENRMSRLVLALLAAALLSSCAVLKPYQRTTLSHASMQMAPQLGDGFQSHMLPIREGAVGGDASIGGGCGCN